jgi:hypothetical protein
MILEWMTKWEPIWLGIVALISIYLEAYTAYWIVREYKYDELKDTEKKRKRTRTTKKVTTQPGGASVTEESTETSEPIMEEKK